MSPVVLHPADIATAASLVVLDALLSLLLALRLHRQLAVASARMVIQLVAVGYVLKLVFAIGRPAATLGIIAVMMLIAAREVAARPERRFRDLSNFGLGAAAVSLATVLTLALALTTAIRPRPWYDPRYAIPLAGIILGSVLNACSLTLDSLLSALWRERGAVEAQLCLGANYWRAVGAPLRTAVRRGLLPVINQMSAAGVVTLPGIMTGQILAGLDPIEAVKYQILLMFLLSGGSGLAAVGVAYLAAARLTDARQRLRLDRLS